MDRIAFWLTVGIAGTLLATPALADWSAKPINDGFGHSYFLARNTVDEARAELFCNPDGVVNFSLSWPDREHVDAAEQDTPATMTVTTDAGGRFEAKSYYWASGKGELIIDFGYPPMVRGIAAALGAAQSEITVTIEDPARGIDKSVTYGTEGAAVASAAFLDWCPPPVD